VIGATWRAALAIVLCLAGAGAHAQSPGPEALRARFAAMRAQPDAAIFDRPLYLQASESPALQQGDVLALVDYDYDAVRRALTRADNWCDILILHLNVKYCRASSTAGHDTLDVGMGRKFDQPLAAVSWLALDYRIERDAEDDVSVALQAPEGPMGARDFRISTEAVPYDARRSLVHLSYAYADGLASRLAMQAYLATIGSDKVGFSVVGHRADGQPIRSGGLRGLLERNTMRYYLAVEAYLAASGLPAAQQPQRRLDEWFTATERYPLQLHEVDRAAYIAMKLGELRRARSEPPPHRH